MNVRKYVVTDMQEGFDRIRRELGGDAVILNQHSVRGKGIAGWFRKPRLEIYAAWDETRPAGLDPRPAKPAENRVVMNGTPAFRLLQDRLMAHDVALDVAAQIIDEAVRISDRDHERPLDAVRRAIAGRIGTHCEIPIKRDCQTRILLAGPAGAGKTTTALKLAAHFKTRLTRDQQGAAASETGPVGLVSADICRAGAHDQIRLLGDLFELPVACIQSPRDAGRVIRQLASCPVILIDTPGCNPSDQDQKRLLDDLIREFRPDEICLCLGAPTGVSCSRRTFERFSFIGDFRLILTKTDELADTGALLNQCVLSSRTLTGLTDSADYLGQLRSANGAAVADQILE